MVPPDFCPKAWVEVVANSALRSGLGLTALTGPARVSVVRVNSIIEASSSRPTQLAHCCPSPA